LRGGRNWLPEEKRKGEGSLGLLILSTIAKAEKKLLREEEPSPFSLVTGDRRRQMGKETKGAARNLLLKRA